LLTLLPFLATVSAAQLPATVVVYPIDASHSEATFTVRHLGLSRVRGRFDDLRGTLLLDTADVTRSSVMVLIRTPSIATGNTRRDDDLKANFFEVDSFPTIVFQSTRVERAGDGLRVHGDLRIRNVTRPVVLEVESLGTHANAQGEHRVGFAGQLRIDRNDYGVRKDGHPAELAGVIGDRVDIELQVEGLTRDYERLAFDSRQRPSIGETLLPIARAQGGEAAVRRYGELREREADAHNFASRELMVAGLRLLQAGHPAAAHVLGLVAANDTANATGHEVFGRALAYAGQQDRAVAALERAVAIDPQSTGALEILRRLGRPVRP